MKIGVQKTIQGGQLLYGSPDPIKKPRQNYKFE